MVLIALSFAGCGSSDDSGDSGGGGSNEPVASGTTVSGGVAPIGKGQEGDRRALEKLSSGFGEIARNGDSEALCQLFEPQRLIEAMGSRQTCIQVMSSVTKPNPSVGEYVVDTVTFKGNEAKVTYEDGYPTAIFEKIDGKWWARPPELPGQG